MPNHNVIYRYTKLTSIIPHLIWWMYKSLELWTAQWFDHVCPIYYSGAARFPQKLNSHRGPSVCTKSTLVADLLWKIWFPLWVLSTWKSGPWVTFTPLQKFGVRPMTLWNPSKALLLCVCTNKLFVLMDIWRMASLCKNSHICHLWAKAFAQEQKFINSLFTFVIP